MVSFVKGKEIWCRAVAMLVLKHNKKKEILVNVKEVFMFMKRISTSEIRFVLNTY